MFQLALLLFLLSSPAEEVCNSNSCPIPNPPVSGWHFEQGKYWVAQPNLGTSLAGSEHCPTGDMIEVEGNMVQDVAGNPFGEGSVVYNQKRTCTHWLSQTFPERCAQFDQARWEKMLPMFPRKPMHFCIDHFEYPNRLGAVPWVMITHVEASKMCQEQGKRLCTEEEWTFACEGEEALPYPNGYQRDSTKCNIDHPWRKVREPELYPRGTQSCGEELQRLWQGNLSGSNPECKSPFGVEDMTGNIDEWTVAVRGNNPAILKGGYWSTVRTRCRPSTRNHLSGHTFYQQGFRCCANSATD
jgi:hypothetical protein